MNPDPYAADDIESLRGLEAIRRRPGVYVGDPADPATVTKLLAEATCLAFDNAVEGCATDVIVTLNSDGSAEVRDNGPGLDLHKDKYGWSAIDYIFTSLHACRKHKKASRHADSMCGVGIVATNALSEWLTYRTTQDGQAVSYTHLTLPTKA